MTGVPLDVEKYKDTEDYDAKFKKLNLGGKQFEGTESSLFQIDETIMKPELYGTINIESLDILVNVFNGRKSFPDNILDCGIMQGHPKNLPSQFSINCHVL